MRKRDKKQSKLKGIHLTDEQYLRIENDLREKGSVVIHRIASIHKTESRKGKVNSPFGTKPKNKFRAKFKASNYLKKKINE